MTRVQIVHWRTLVCPGGHRAENIDGVHMWLADDQHLSEAGGVVVWKWWLPQLRHRAQCRRHPLSTRSWSAHQVTSPSSSAPTLNDILE